MPPQPDNILGTQSRDPYDPYGAGKSKLASRIFWSCSLLFVLFILLASLIPSQNSGQVFGQWQKLEQTSLFALLSLHSLRDITTNVLLYMPLGVFLAMAVSARNPRFLSPWLLAGPVISFSIEYGQVFIGRFSDPIDVVTNSSGYLLGFWIIVVAIRFFYLNPAALLGIDTARPNVREQTIAALRFLYAAVFWIVALLPFDVSVRIGDLYGQLFPDRWGKTRIILDIFHHFRSSDHSFATLLLAFIGLLPVGLLRTLRQGLHARTGPGPAIISCLLLVLLTEGAQIFIMSKTTDIIMLPMAVIAGICGWGAATIWMSLNRWHMEPSDSILGPDHTFLAVVCLGYFIFLCLLSWSPYQFELGPRTIFSKIIHQSNLMPFKYHFSDRSLSGALDLVKESGLYLPLGVLTAFTLAQLIESLPRFVVIFLAAILCSITASFLELSQAAVVGRYIDITDVIMASVGGVIGAVISTLFIHTTDSRT